MPVQPNLDALQEIAPGTVGWDSIVGANNAVLQQHLLGQPLAIKVYTVGTLPDPALYEHCLAMVSDGSYGRALMRSTGAAWVYADRGAVPQALNGGVDPVTWDAAAGEVATLDLSASRTLALPTNLQPGRVYRLIVKQNGVGGFTLGYNAGIKWPGGADPVVAAGANDVSVLTFLYDPGAAGLYGLHAALDLS